MQVVVLMSENDRGQNHGSEFAGNRRSDDMQAEVRIEFAAFMKNGKEHAEGSRRQYKADEQRRPNNPMAKSNPANRPLRPNAASHASTPRRSGAAPIFSGLNSNPAWKNKKMRPNSPRNPMAPWLVNQPTPLGPITIPSMSSRTTAGMRMNAGNRASNGAKTATKPIIKRA